jgi:hypothetical protein
VNIAPCFLRMNQTRALTGFWLDHHPEAHTIVVVTAMRDFEQCSVSPALFFDPELMHNYLTGRSPAWWMYFRNFRVTSFLSDAVRRPERLRELHYDAFGSSPLTRSVPVNGGPFSPEPGCYSELSGLARDIAARGKTLIVVTFPVMPEWRHRYDPEGRAAAAFSQSVRQALRETGAILIDGQREWPLPTSAFTDPVHLQWPETAAFTRFVWNSAVRSGAPLPPLPD